MSLRAGVLALIQVPALTVFDGGLPSKNPDGTPYTAPTRYAVLYAGAGLLTGGDVAFTPDELAQSLQITSVGRSASEAEWVARQCRDAVVGKTPTASGWVAGPVMHVGSEVARRDEDRPDGTVFFCTDRYDVLAARA